MKIISKSILSFAITLCLVFSSFGLSYAESSKESFGYGYIDRNGNVVIDYQYDYAYAFNMGRGRVFSGKLSNYGYPDEGLYGYIDSTGSFVIQPKYEEATDFENDGYAVVAKNGKYGIIDINGNSVIDFSYDYITYIADGIYDAFSGSLTSYGSPDKGTHDIIRADGTIIFSGDYKYIYYYDDFYEASKNDKYALLALDGTPITAYEFDFLTSESEGIVGFEKGSYYGYIDITGKTIIEAKYDSVGSFTDGKAIVEENGRYYLIDKTGTVLQTYKADYVSEYPVNNLTYAFEGTLTDYGSPDNGYYYLMDLDGNYITRGYKAGDCYPIIDDNGYWRVKEGDTWYFVDTKDNEITNSIECEDLDTCGNDRYFAEKNGLYALLNEKGELLTDYFWDDLSSTTSDLIPAQHLAIEPDFRTVRWGMTEEEVKNLEGNLPDYSGELDGRNAWYIGYDTNLMGNSVIVAYYFGTNGLYEARYIWSESHSNENLYISDYNSVKNELTKKYGSPWWDQENWDTSSHESYYSDKKGEALSFGYLTYETCYDTSRTDITMQMYADNYDISFIVYYESQDISAPTTDYSDLF